MTCAQARPAPVTSPYENPPDTAMPEKSARFCRHA